MEPGATVRWIVRENVHTTTAYHPRNDHHPLRIPESAVPWDSGFLVHPGDHFDVTLTVPGVYDYYCMPHEAVGMVGRIVVGQPLGPGAQTFDYWVGRPGTDGWRPVPDAARQTFPSAARRSSPSAACIRPGRGSELVTTTVTLSGKHSLWPALSHDQDAAASPDAANCQVIGLVASADKLWLIP